MARSLNQQINWLWDDLQKQLGVEVMSKRPEIGENIACERNKAQEPDEAALQKQKQKRIESEPSTPSAIRYNSWTQLCDKLIEMKARKKEEAEKFVQSTWPKSKPTAEETTSDSKQLEELAKETEVWKEQELNKDGVNHGGTHSSSPTKLSSQNVGNVAIMTSDGADLAKSTADSMAKNDMHAQKAQGQGTNREQHKILDNEIALLLKKKIRQELEREVVENEGKAAEALRQKKQAEQCQKKWDDEREAKELKTKPKIEQESEEQFWDRWDEIDWEKVFGVAAFIVLGIPLGCTGAMVVWHIFFTIFRHSLLG